MKYQQLDYKGKYFVLQDSEAELDHMDYPIGEMDDKEITDGFLQGHVQNCRYYGIPAYFGKNKDLHRRIDKLHEVYEELEKLEHGI